MWEKIFDKEMLEIRAIRGSSSYTSYHPLPKAKLELDKFSLPKVVDRDFSRQEITLIIPFRQEDYRNQVTLPFHNPLQAGTNKGIITELACGIRNKETINRMYIKVLLDGLKDPQIKEYLAYSDISYEFGAYISHGFSIRPIDRRHQSSSLEGTFTPEMEVEFRKVLDLCPEVAFDFEHCLGLLKER